MRQRLVRIGRICHGIKKIMEKACKDFAGSRLTGHGLNICVGTRAIGKSVRREERRHGIPL